MKLKTSAFEKLVNSSKQCYKALKQFAKRRRVESVREEEIGDQVHKIVQSLSLASVDYRRSSSVTTDTWLEEVVDNMVNERLEEMTT